MSTNRWRRGVVAALVVGSLSSGLGGWGASLHAAGAATDAVRLKRVAARTGWSGPAPAGLAAALQRAGLTRLNPAVQEGTSPDRSWTQQAELMAADGGGSLGISVALSGNTALVGATHATHAHHATGAAYVFVRSGATWTQQAKLAASDASYDDYFGNAVALSGDTALVGAYRQNEFTGAAYVFVRHGTTWTQQAKLVASDGVAEDMFGSAVALVGNTAMVGAPFQYNFTGAVYVFVRSGTTWSQQSTLTVPGGTPGASFGVSMAISGTTALIGADARNGSGTAYIFARSGATWSRQATLTAADAASGDFFGYSVALSGGTALVGAPYKNSNTGAAYVFARSGTTWTQQTELAAADGTQGDWFGASAALNGSTALVSAPYKNTQTGAAYVFTRSGTTWSQRATLTASDAAAYDEFGTSMALSGSTALIGAPYKNNSTGVTYVFVGM